MNTLQYAWDDRANLHKSANNLSALIDELSVKEDPLLARLEQMPIYVKAYKTPIPADSERVLAQRVQLYAQIATLHAEAERLRAKAHTLRATGDLTWVEAIIERYGNVELTWEGSKCTVNGETYS